MSQIYNLEPPTSGSVRLETTHGPLLLNLWTNEAPTTCRNFLQHCMNGYYSGLPFHRVIPDVLVQTGDPSNTGSGGEAALGDPAGFPRELHGRLRFRRRGLVAMVCEEGLARSQFFITLSATEWLNGQHSIFAEVAGNTVYNLLNLAEHPVDGFDHPAAPRLNAVMVLQNPFTELKPVAVSREVGKEESVVTAKRAVRKRNLLSFADSDSEDDDRDLARLPKRRPRTSQKPPEKAVTEAKDADMGMGQAKEETTNEDDAVILAANAEFERLKAQLEVAETTPKEIPRGNGGVPKGRKDETELLKRLEAFEKRVASSRKEARKEGNGRIEGAWFEKGLRLATSVMEEEEYEVHFGQPRGR